MIRGARYYDRQTKRKKGHPIAAGCFSYATLVFEMISEETLIMRKTFP